MASRYAPTQQIASVTQRINLTDQGRTLLYASEPVIESGAQFNQNCESVERTAAMLGCYHRQRIYLFNVQNPELDGAVEVTAAHEMLHAAYDRLNIFEKRRVDALITREYEAVKDDPDIKALMAYYSKAEPGAELNELHSIIGTTIKSISPDLESHYGQYFTDRAVIVGLNAKYGSVFKDVQARADALSSSLNRQGAELKTALAQYDADRAKLEADIAAFNAQAERGASGSRSAFEASRLALVTRVKDLDARRDTINTRVNDYNANVEELRSLSIRVDELNKSINGISSPSVGL